MAAMDRGESVIYSGRISSDDLLGEPDLLRKEGDGYVAGDIKSGAGDEGASEEHDGKPKIRYAGAQWRPDEPREIQWVRRNLFECAADVTAELIEQLMKHTACSHDTILDLLQTPAMKKHLTPVARRFGLMGSDTDKNRKRKTSGGSAPLQKFNPCE